MRKYFLLAVLILTSGSFAQNKYMIYLKDKGITKSERLEKTGESYQSALDELTERCIIRRIKNLGEDNIISYEDVPLRNEYLSVIETLDIKIENKLKWFNAVSAYLTGEQLNFINQLAFVEKVEPVRILKFGSELPAHSEFLNKLVPDDFPINYGPSFDQLKLSDVPIVHSEGINGQDVLVGMLDTGFDWKNHESLKEAKIIAEYDFVHHDNVTSDEGNDQPGQHNHGTLTFSVVGGFKDSSLIGAAFGSDFILAKTEDIRSETHVEEDNYAAALEWMENLGVDITSSSLGYNIFDPPQFSYSYEDMDGKTTIVTRAAEIAFRKGVLTVTSAGNEGTTQWYYIIAPADGINSIGVGAVDGDNQLAGFSSRGPSSDGRIKPDVVTKGVSVFGAVAGSFNGYRTASGTSLSAPIASGIASLVLSAHRHLKNTQLRSILFETADNNDAPDFERGYGLLSALRAVEFPNLEFTGGTYTVRKMFIEKDDIVPGSVSLHFSTNGIDFTDVPMTFDDERTYTYKMPYLFDGDSVRFYFTYEDNLNNTFREPEDDNYKFIYGQLEVSLNLQIHRKFTDYIVSEVFPNPFQPASHSFTRLALKSSGNEKLRIAIIDVSGQQVKVFETITNEGENYFDWDGISDRGIPCASGVYYYLIRLGDRDFGRKMILIK